MRYRFGIIFNFERQLRLIDPTNVLQGVNQHWLLIEVVKFLTEDVRSGREGYAQCNEMEYFINLLCEDGILPDHIFRQDEPYTRICAILLSLCESVVEAFVTTRFYDHCYSYHKDKPAVFQISKSSYAILLKPYRG